MKVFAEFQPQPQHPSPYYIGGVGFGVAELGQHQMGPNWGGFGVWGSWLAFRVEPATRLADDPQLNHVVDIIGGSVLGAVSRRHDSGL